LRYICCCCYKKPKTSFKRALRRSIRNQLKIPETNNERLVENDPFLVLGMGMNEYFNTMVKMMIFFLICTLVLFPFCFHFAAFKGLDSTKYFWLTKYQLGNIGGASTYCTTSSFASPTNELLLMCESGYLDLDAIGNESGELIYTAGVIPSNTVKKNFCVNPNSIDSTITDCSPYMELEKLEEKIRNEC
jgi:hypothetical protein